MSGFLSKIIGKILGDGIVPLHDVAVMGIAPEEVAEITVLTMQGSQVANFRNVHRFNISRLAPASYIVRVATTEGKVHYLKLVKQ